MTRSICLFLAAIIFAATTYAQIPYSELMWKGQAVPFYGESRSPMQAQLLDTLKRNHQAERWAQVINGTLRLKSNLGIGFNACGTANAYFDGQRNSVTICLELMELMIQLAKNDQVMMGLDRTTFSKILDGAIWGILFHELAHAIITIDGLPITGREEDVADQFMAYFAVNFIEPRGNPVITPTIWFFGSMAKGKDIGSLDQDGLRRLLADEHSLDMQRIYNLACWAYGGNPQIGQDAVNAVDLPSDRLARCPGEWATLSNGVHNRFKKAIKAR